MENIHVVNVEKILIQKQKVMKAVVRMSVLVTW